MKTIYFLTVTALLFFQSVNAQNNPKKSKKLILRASVISMQGDTSVGYISAFNDSSVEFAAKSNDLRSNTHDSTYKIFQYDDISEMRIHRKGSVGRGIIYGSIGGAIVGGIVGAITYKKPENTSTLNQELNLSFDFGPEASIAGGAILGAAGGTLIGALFGSTARKTFVIGGDKEKFQEMQRKCKLF